MAARSRRIARAAAALAVSAAAAVARADGVTARVEPGYLSTTTRSAAEGTTTETESTAVTQKYGLTADVSPLPLLRLMAGGLLDWSNGTTTSPAQTADFDQKRWTGYGRFDLGGPEAKLGAGYDRREDWTRTEVSEVVAKTRLIHDVLSGYALLRPEALPAVDLRLSRSHDYDLDRALANRFTDTLGLGVRYEPAPPWELRYSLNAVRPQDALRGTETLSIGHFGRVTYQASPLAKRLNVFASLEGSRTDATTRVTGTGGTVSTQQFPVRGLSALEAFPAVPERITLEQNPALVDGNVAATAGLDLGYRASAGTTVPPRELGVQFGDNLTPVNELHVWVDRRLPDDLVRLFTWSAWRSNDNVTWERVDPVGAVRFDPFETRFEVPIPRIAARYVKLVVSPLPTTASTDPQFATILVTEVQTFLVEPAAEKKGTTSQTRGAFNGGVRYLFASVPGLSYDLSTFLRAGGGLPRSTWSVTNGLSYTRPLGASVTLNARVDRSDLDETRGHESSNGYAVGISATPLPTLSANLSANGVYQDTPFGSEWRNAVVLATSADLYQGVSVGANGSLSYSQTSAGRTTRATDGRASLSLVPHRTFTLSTAFAASGTRASGASLPTTSDSTGRLDASASFTPVPALLFSGAHTRYTWGPLAPQSVSSVGATASPFSGGALLVRFSFAESLDTGQELRSRSWGPGLRWNIRPRWFLDVTYTRATGRTPALETRSDTFFANLLGIIG